MPYIPIAEARGFTATRGNPGKIKEYTNKRRALQNDSSGSFTSQEWEELCSKYDYKCLACGEARPLAADHVIPISLGGASDIRNIQPLCKSCNSKKYTKSTDYRLILESAK